MAVRVARLCSRGMITTLPLLLALASSGASIQEPQAAPNVVLVLVDDLGWADLGCYGNDFIETPRIDGLAARGLRFTDAYASGPVCSPTRSALQSGQYQVRSGITAHIPGHWRPFERVITPRPAMALPLDVVTVAELLRGAGYRTGYVGKWHLGSGARFQPDRQGYDLSAVISGPHLPGRYGVQGEVGRQPRPDQYRTDYEADLCIDFIRGRGERPFFLMLSPYAVHIPLAAMSEKVERYRRKAEERGTELPHPVYAAMVEHCDDMLGRILDCLEEEGITEQTMVIFTSDNGGLLRRYDYRPEADDVVSSQAPLRGEKGTLFEGGVRVPLIVSYPPLLEGGSETSAPAISHDLFPTLAELAGAKVPPGQTLDGKSLLPLLQDPAAALGRDALFWHYPHYHHDRPASSIRRGRWKLIEYLDGTGEVLLFDLEGDPGEGEDLSARRPELAGDLRSELEAWRRGMLARMPLPNPSHDSERAGEWWSTGTGQPVRSKARKRFPATEKD